MSKFRDSGDNGNETPHDLARKLLSFTPDPIQTELLTTTTRNVILNCHRQWGKTIMTALRALYQALKAPKQLIVVISPTLEQSKILTKRCRDFARDLNIPVTTDGTNPRSVLFPNGSLILPIAADADHARGWSANLLSSTKPPTSTTKSTPPSPRS